MDEPWLYRNEYDHVPRPIVARARSYPPSFELEWHTHGRGQFVYAASGVVVLSTPYGTWVAPPERAVWTPAGMPHSVRMVGAVETRSVLLDEETARLLGPKSAVLSVSSLLRQLLITAADLPLEYDVGGRDGLVMGLLAAELARAPRVALSVPFPASPKLAARCHAFLEQPRIHDTIEDWCGALGMDRRAFTRTFRRETGMSFGEWRQQACLLVALPRLADGESITAVALDLGYDSPAAFSTMFRRLLGVPPSRYASGD